MTTEEGTDNWVWESSYRFSRRWPLSCILKEEISKQRAGRHLAEVLARAEAEDRLGTSDRFLLVTTAGHDDQIEAPLSSCSTVFPSWSSSSMLPGAPSSTAGPPPSKRSLSPSFQAWLVADSSLAQELSSRSKAEVSLGACREDAK